MHRLDIDGMLWAFLGGGAFGFLFAFVALAG